MESHCRNIAIVLILFVLTAWGASNYKPVFSIQQHDVTRMVKSPILFRVFPIAQESNRFLAFIVTEVQYDFLQFFEENGHFTARAQLEFTFSDAARNQTFTKIITITTTTSTFDSTNLKTLYYPAVDSLHMPAGNYHIILVYRDLNSGRTVELKSQVALHLQNGYFYPIPLFCSPVTPTSVHLPFCTQGVPAAITGYWEFNRDAWWVIHVNGLPTNSPQPVQIAVRSRRDPNPVFAVDTTVYLDTLYATANIRVPLSQLEEGSYNAVVTFPHTQPRIRFTVPLTIVWFTKPLSLWSLDTAIPPLKYILSDEEWKAFKKGNRQQIEQRFRDFWKARDPDPETPYNAVQEEFYRRVDEANRRWSTRRQPGWRTDRGKIFILYGEPDEVEDRTLAPEPPQYLKWIYHRNSQRIIAVFDAIEGRKILKLRSIITETNHEEK